MRRWIIFGLVVILAFIAAANLTGPSAWASDSQAQVGTVPTPTPKQPTKPPKEPTDTPIPPPTDTPVVIQPTSTAIVVPPTETATVRATVATRTPAPTSTARTATATTVVSSPTATNSPTPTAVVNTPTVAGTASAAGAAPVDMQPGNSTLSNSTSVWLLVPAAALVILGAVLLFGRRAKSSNK